MMANDPARSTKAEAVGIAPTALPSAMTLRAAIFEDIALVELEVAGSA